MARTFMTGLVSVALYGCVARPLLGDMPDADASGTTELEGGGQTSGLPTSSGSSAGTQPQPGTTDTGTEPEPGTTTTGSPGSTTTTTEDTCGFICETTEGPPEPGCDVFKQNCPEGQKCAPYAEDGDSWWNATKCVPVTGDGQPGESCMTMGGGVSGLDDCAEGVFCWDVDAMNVGECVEMCSGSDAAPVCKDEDANCAVTSEGALNLCIPSCDPLVQDCAGDDLCIPIADTFVCVLDASGADTGKALDPCEFANACDKGLLCLNPTASENCDPNAGGCCMPFCDLADQAAADAGCKAIADDTSCVSLYEAGMAPPKFETVGICVVPA